MNRRNKIWTASVDDLKNTVATSNTLSDILKFFGLCTSSANYVALKTRLKKENIDFSHIRLGNGSNKNRPMPWLTNGAKSLSDILVEGSTYDRRQLKQRLLKEGLLDNKCYECDLPPEWNGKILSLQIDHINGISNDNRIENLRILCPNCHAQTDNYAGKNVAIANKQTLCIDCGQEIQNNSIRCIGCSNKSKGKIDWDKISNLIEMVNNYGFSKVGRILGISDNAVRKRFNKIAKMNNSGID